MMICDECGSNNNSFDEIQGERICNDCGLILVQEMFEETVHILDTGGNLKHSADKGRLGSVITGKGSYKFNKFGKNSVIPQHIQNALMHCNMILAHVAPNLGLNERVEKLYLDLNNKGVFGRSQIEARATAVVFYALRENGTPHTFAEVSAEFDANLKSVKRLVRKINQVFRNKAGYSPVNPQYLLEKTLNDITDDLVFRRQTIKVLEFFETKVAQNTFNKGRSYYASIIWISANMNVNTLITQNLITKKTGFSRFNIRRQTKAILSMIGLELASQVKGKQLSELGE
mgnify:FL=1